MDKWVMACELSKHVGKDVMIKGWLYNKRSSGKIAFLQVRDGSDMTQVVIEKKAVSEQIWEAIEKATIESTVMCSGIANKHPKKEEYEIHGNNFHIIHLSEEYPIGAKEHGPDFLLDHRHLWLRSSKQWAIQRVRNTIINATYDWMGKNHFIKIDSPILTPSACEGTTTLFEVEYFDLGKAYLSQSGQLYLEAAIASHGRVFDFGPVFRAEKSKTRRHLIEFWMMDAEAAFVEHEGNLKFQEELVTHMVKSVLAKNKKDLEILERDIQALEKIEAPFYRMTHHDAVKKLHTMGSHITHHDDLGAEDETKIVEGLDKPIFIEKYPAEVKAFYMRRDPENHDLALCADLIAPEGFGEIIGGSERESDHDTLVKRIKEHNLPLEAFKWYLDLRKFGSCPHSGFGFGLERITAWLTGTRHIRETIPFPRLLNRITP